MPNPQIAPYGSWKSPITSDLIVAETIRLGAPQIDGDALTWLEGRPQDGGRLTVVQQTASGTARDLTADPYNIRTRVHEYGGGAYTLSQGTLYFSNFGDQRLYRQTPGKQPVPLTLDISGSQLRYADFEVDQRRDCLFCVREDHRAVGEHDGSSVGQGSKSEEINSIVRIKDVAARSTSTGTSSSGDSAEDATSSEDEGSVLISGNDFYASPRLSPDGSKLAWLTWNHPNMPWDGTELWVSELNPDGTVAHSTLVAGGIDESITQPVWSPDGVLTFLSDRTGWWNLYRWENADIISLCPMEAEFGSPQWQFGTSSYAYQSVSEIICIYGHHGQANLARLSLDHRELTNIPTRFTSMGNLSVDGQSALFLGSSPTESSSVVLLDLSNGQAKVLRQSSAIAVNDGYISQPQAIEFPTENGLTAHAFYYPPQNQDFDAPPEERPPLMVLSHGGPTGATSASLSMKTQYWTSRGFAVVDVNYGGSSGYGRAYRQRLNGQWGIVDVDDCVNAARHLVDQGLADGERLAIAGGSAGGYTTLCALAFRNVFKAGASHFGIADLEILAQHTHKFESRYIDGLVGPYPDRQDLYRERSPIYAVDQFSCPLILFQGLEDKVVPPEQSQMMFDAVLAKGIPVAYLPFEGEQHGFRQAENIKRSLDAELYFYGAIFGFAVADEIEPVDIKNL